MSGRGGLCATRLSSILISRLYSNGHHLLKVPYQDLNHQHHFLDIDYFPITTG
jgi:hypothetical protein